MKYYLAIDIGASSGRHIVGRIDGGEVKTKEVYRFKNGMTEQEGHLVWDIDALKKNVIDGIKAAFSDFPDIESAAIDTWGVDYVLLKGDEAVLPCYAYRDSRTEAVIPEVHGIAPFEKLYEKTGIQFQPFNSIYQLYDDKLSGRLDGVTDFLMIPDYLTYCLTGKKVHEYTNATTMGLVNAEHGEFDGDIIKSLGLPGHLFGKLSKPGELVGKLKPEIAEYAGGQLDVVLCASHDTGSAVEGIPMNEGEIYLSSGTWSLLGVRAEKPKTDKESLACNYTNEGGVGYIRFLKNIMGMWVFNNLKNELCPDKPYSQIEAEAAESDFNETVDVNAKAFLAPKSMRSAFDSTIVGDKPKCEADYFRCCFRSLAYSYKNAVNELEGLTNKQYHELYIVGGGARNKVLNKMTEEICGIKVVALPIEATSLGNIIIQSKRIYNNMKENIFNAPFIKEMSEITANMYRQGWDERNGGNISYLLDTAEVEKYLDLNRVIRTIPIGFKAKELVGRIFIVTGTGKYFKNVEKDPETNLGIIRIAEDGENAELLWGYRDGGRFTSELPAHLMSHIARLNIDSCHRVVMHTHPTYTIAMNTVCPTDEKDFTHKLWQSNTECVVVFPDGVGVLPCMVCGTNEIGEATAEKMKKFRLVVWTNHGIYGTGKDIDEAFGLIETVEKTAMIYMLTLDHKVNVISDEILWGLADRFDLKPLDGVLTERKVK